MAHTDVPVEGLQRLLGKYLVDQPHPLVDGHTPFGSFRIADGDPAALLSPMLQGKQAVIDRGRHIVPVQIIGPKDPTRLFQSTVTLLLFFHVASSFYWIPRRLNTSS